MESDRHQRRPSFKLSTWQMVQLYVGPIYIDRAIHGGPNWLKAWVTHGEFTWQWCVGGKAKEAKSEKMVKPNIAICWGDKWANVGPISRKLLEVTHEEFAWIWWRRENDKKKLRKEHLSASCGHDVATRKAWRMGNVLESGLLKSADIWNLVKSDIWWNLTSGEIWHLVKSEI